MRNIALLLCFLPLFSQAEPQKHDTLVWNNSIYLFYSEPLELYGDIDKISAFRNASSAQKCTAAEERGYVANWKIEGGELYLTALKAECTNIETLFKQWFPELYAGQTVKATWVKGNLWAVGGELLKSPNDYSYADIYEADLMLTFKNGILSKENRYSNRSNIPLLAHNIDSFTNLMYAQVDWKLIPKNELKKDIRVKLMFGWYGHGLYESIMIADSTSQALSAALEPFLARFNRLPADGEVGRWTYWFETITIDEKRVKKLLKTP